MHFISGPQKILPENCCPALPHKNSPLASNAMLFYASNILVVLNLLGAKKECRDS